MASRPTVKDLVERNKEYAKTHTPWPTFSEMKASGAPGPSTLIVTCIDPRCRPTEFMNVKALDAIVLSNVCGHVGPNLKDILAVDNLFGFKELVVIQHTDCGALLIDEPSLRGVLEKRSPGNPVIADKTGFGAITSVEQSIRDDLAKIKSSPLMRKELVEQTFGFIYDIKTGLLNPVSA